MAEADPVEAPAPVDQNLYVEDLAWPPPTWNAGGEQVSTPEWATPLPGSIPQPPPAPAPVPPPQNPPSKPAPTGDKKLDDGTPVLDEVPLAAGTAGAGAVPSSPLAAVQPGLGVPTATLDALGAPPDQLAGPVGAAPVTPGPQPPTIDAISGAAPLAHGSVKDELAAQGIDEVREALPPNEQADGELADRLSQDPKALAKYLSDQATNQRNWYEAQQKQLIADEQDKASRNLATVTTAQQKAQADTNQLLKDATALANKPLDTSLHLGVLGTLGMIVASTLGGAASHWTGGQNWALQEWDKAINDHIDAQKSNLASQWKALGMKQDAYTQEYARSGDAYRAQETFRVGMYQLAQNKLLTEMQNYDPHGTAVGRLAQLYQGLDAQKQQAIAAFQDRQYKNNKEAADAELANASAAEKWANVDKIEGKTGGAGGAAGAGGPTNQQYTVATGYFDPFDMKTPIMGRRQVGGKGEDPTERKLLQTQLDEYKHVQDQLKKMHDIVVELGDGGKGISESLWKKRKTTLGADYDAAREALVSYLTKAIGDRPTQGQLELQAQRIPERASVFEARDPAKLIESQQEEADRALATDLGVIGVDPSSLIQHAKEMRAPAPEPAITDDVAAAQKALSTAQPGTSEYRDAEAALEYANERRAQKIRRKTSDQAAVQEQTGEARNSVLPDTLDVAGLPPVVQARVESYNQAIETHQRELDHLLDLQSQKPQVTGQRGVDQKTAGDRADLIARQAGISRDAERAQRAAMNDALRATLEHLDELDPEKRKAILDLADQVGVNKPIRDKAEDFALNIVTPGSVVEPRSTKRLVDAAIGEGGSNRFRYGLLKILGSADFKDYDPSE